MCQLFISLNSVEMYEASVLQAARQFLERTIKDMKLSVGEEMQLMVVSCVLCVCVCVGGGDYHNMNTRKCVCFMTWPQVVIHENILLVPG